MTILPKATRSSSIAAICALAVTMTMGCTKRGSRDPADPDDAPGPGEQKTAGALLFEKHCAKCHGALGKGKGDVPPVVGEGALSRFTNAQELFDFVSKEMPRDKPGSLEPGEYWAILGFDIRANGIKLDEPLGPQNAASIVLHAEGDAADDKHDAAKGDNTDDRVSSDVNE